MIEVGLHRCGALSEDIRDFPEFRYEESSRAMRRSSSRDFDPSEAAS
jgi:hypothetical protein